MTAPPAAVGGVTFAQFAPWSRVTWIWLSSVPAQITRASTYDGPSVAIAPRDSSGLISIQVWPPVAVFQTELAPNSNVFGSVGANVNGGVAETRNPWPRAGPTSCNWPDRRSKRVTWPL